MSLQESVKEAIELLCEGKVDTQEIVDLLELALMREENTKENT